MGRDRCMGIWCKRRGRRVELCWCHWGKGGGRDLCVARRDVEPPRLWGYVLGFGELRAKKAEFLFVHVTEMIDCLAMSRITFGQEMGVVVFEQVALGTCGQGVRLLVVVSLVRERNAI